MTISPPDLHDLFEIALILISFVVGYLEGRKERPDV